MTQRHADAPLATDAATAKTSRQRTIDALIQASPSSQGQSSLAHAGMLRAARALTATAIELVQRPELIAQAKAELVERRQGKPYQCPIPAEAPLPF